MEMIRLHECKDALANALLDIEKRFHEIASPPDNPGHAERQTAGTALLAVIEFLRINQIKGRPLERLNAALEDVATTGRLAAMFSGPKPANRPVDAITVQQVKGVLAGIVYILMIAGLKREEAGTWMVRRVPQDISRKISHGIFSRGKLSCSTVLDWYDRLSGPKGNQEPGYGQYLKVIKEGVFIVERAIVERAVGERVPQDSAAKEIKKYAARLLKCDLGSLLPEPLPK